MPIAVSHSGLHLLHPANLSSPQVKNVPHWQEISDRSRKIEYVWKYRALHNDFPPAWRSEPNIKRKRAPDDDAGVNTGMDEQEGTYYSKLVQVFEDLWSCQALDEGHSITNRETLSNTAIRNNKPLLGTIVISATIFSNSIFDAIAILELLWPPDLDIPKDIAEYETEEDFVREFHDNPAVPLHLKASPHIFKLFVNKCQMQLESARKILPSVLRATIIHREIGDLVEVGDGTTEMIGENTHHPPDCVSLRPAQ